jgi:hypothetical protein
MNDLALGNLRDGILSRIQRLSTQWAKNTIELGREFKAVRETFPIEGSNQRPGWYDWIKNEAPFQKTQVKIFIQIADKFGDREAVAGLGVDLLTYLSRDALPEAGLADVIKRVERGEKITVPQAKEIIKPHLPTRKEAIQQARETGKLVAARDGHMYSGASEDEMLAYSERRKIVYAIRRAVDEIATVELTPNQWVNSAEDHWVHEFKLSHVEEAIDWLTKLVPLLSKRQKVVDNGTR